MKAVDIPAKFPIPFANNAGGSYIWTIPEASQIGITDGRASLFDGFVPLNFIPVGAGGVPPFGKDFNGLLYQSTAWDRWASVGGPVMYDAVQAAAIGGYPKGAVVQASSGTNFWLSTADDNATDPDGLSPANWIGFAYTTSLLPTANVTLAVIASIAYETDEINGMTLVSQAGLATSIQGGNQIKFPQAGKYMFVVKNTIRAANVLAATQCAIITRLKVNGVENNNDMETTYLLSGQDLTVSNNLVTIADLAANDLVTVASYVGTTTSGEYGGGQGNGGSMTVFRLGA